MFTTLFKSLPLAKAGQVPMLPRQINLSGNLVNFSMPENFSKDMPAEDMLEKLDISDPSKFSQDSVTLLRRWWDFNEPGWFGRETGTLMMSINIRKINSDNLDITQPLNFVTLLGRQLKQQFEKENQSAAEEFRIQYSQYLNEFAEKVVHDTRWVLHLTRPVNGSHMAYHYATPLMPDIYLEVEFVSAPVDNINLRHFIDTYTDPLIENIISSFDILYRVDNPLRRGLEAHRELQLQQLIEQQAATTMQ